MGLSLQLAILLAAIVLGARRGGMAPITGPQAVSRMFPIVLLTR